MIKIERAFLTDWIAAAFGIDYTFAEMPTTYTPTSGTPYAELRTVPNDQTAYSSADTDETDGVFITILRYPPLSKWDGKEMAQSVLDRYPVGKVLTYDGQSVKTTFKTRTQGEVIDGWYQITVSIGYRAFLTREKHE